MGGAPKILRQFKLCQRESRVGRGWGADFLGHDRISTRAQAGLAAWMTYLSEGGRLASRVGFLSCPALLSLSPPALACGGCLRNKFVLCSCHETPFMPSAAPRRERIRRRGVESLHNELSKQTPRGGRKSIEGLVRAMKTRAELHFDFIPLHIE